MTLKGGLDDKAHGGLQKECSKVILAEQREFYFWVCLGPCVERTFQVEAL